MDFHEIASIFPLLSEEELEKLSLSLKAKGLRHPIVLYEGKILDGRNRYLACQKAGLEPIFEQFKDGDPLEFVVTENLERRQLTREQRDDVIRKLRGEGMTLQKIADTVGVNVATAQRATADFANANSEIENERGQKRPARYAPRERKEEDFTIPVNKVVSQEGDDDLDSPPKPHVAFNSGYSEWYTPKNYIERVVAVMGGIDLDPASTEIANKVVGATDFYTAENDGLKKTWKGRVFMNPPYAAEFIGKFTNKLLHSTGITEAIVLVNNATETKWFQALAQEASAICFPSGRVKFWNPKKESAPLQGQAVIYLGKNAGKFIKHFSDLGTTWRK